jgi:hypothetical protein
MSKLGKILKDDETLIQEARQHLIIVFWPGLISLILFLTPFFLLYPLFGLGSWGIVLFSTMILAGLWLAVRTFVIWYNNFTVLTDKRIIFFSQRGMFDRKIFDLELEFINDIVLYTQGFGAVTFKYDNLQISLIHQNKVKKKWLYRISDGQAFREMILDNVKIAKAKKEPVFYSAEEVIEKTPMVELFKIMRQIRDKIGDERFIEALNKKD